MCIVQGLRLKPALCTSHATAYQKAVREQRLAAEISAAKRERDFYLSRVDKAKAVAAQQERKRKARSTIFLWASCGARLLLKYKLIPKCELLTDAACSTCPARLCCGLKGTYCR